MSISRRRTVKMTNYKFYLFITIGQISFIRIHENPIPHPNVHIYTYLFYSVLLIRLVTTLYICIYVFNIRLSFAHENLNTYLSILLTTFIEFNT